MNLLDAPPEASADDDLDRLLTAYYRSEMPHPWPKLAPPLRLRPAVVEGQPGRSVLTYSRLTLAASVAALVAGGWLLSGRLPVAAPGPGVSLEGGSAKVPKELRHKVDAPRPGRESR
jgi:hypothetical protein